MIEVNEKYLGKAVGTLEFDGQKLDVYRDVNDPLFLAVDVAKLLGYQARHYVIITDHCEVDEIVQMYELHIGPFITENGLYNVLSQERGPLARKWRRVIHDEIIRARRQRGLDIIAKFEEWDHELDTLYFDEETGILMQSVTVQGGDVEQIPYVPKEATC